MTVVNVRAACATCLVVVLVCVLGVLVSAVDTSSLSEVEATGGVVAHESASAAVSELMEVEHAAALFRREHAASPQKKPITSAAGKKKKNSKKGKKGKKKSAKKSKKGKGKKKGKKGKGKGKKKGKKGKKGKAAKAKKRNVASHPAAPKKCNPKAASKCGRFHQCCRGVCVPNAIRNQCGRCRKRGRSLKCGKGSVCRLGQCACLNPNAMKCVVQPTAAATNATKSATQSTKSAKKKKLAKSKSAKESSKKAKGVMKPAAVARASVVCVNPQRNTSHCGRCNRACPAGHSCHHGRCRAPCKKGTKSCRNKKTKRRRCVTLATSNTHCGKCNNVCGKGLTCNKGKCVKGKKVKKNNKNKTAKK